MSFLSAKAPKPIAVPDPSDLLNRLNNDRGKRLAAGGRNSTMLGATIDTPAAAPRATLTGLNGA
jgi:hypothetical protein